MALPLYLAMTAAEMAGCEVLPPRSAWMACHFSSYGLALSNTPQQLPEGSLLILNDRIPVQGHDPQAVARQLAALAEALSAGGILLDLQRAGNPQTAAIVRAVTEALPCPVAVTEHYAGELSCPVFLEAPRCYHHLRDHAAQWQGRELWLEASFSPGTVTVTEEGSCYTPGADLPGELPIHRDEGLHCYYCIQKRDRDVRFFFHRSADNLRALLEEGEALGITRAIGLYQELADTFPCDP